jgi:TIR domain
MGDVSVPTDKLKLFISYSRRDMAAADATVLALEGQGFEVTIDRRDLPYGEEWQQELADFIRASDTVVWLVSPDSVKSRWCNWELGEVVRLKTNEWCRSRSAMSRRRICPRPWAKFTSCRPRVCIGPNCTSRPSWRR